MIDEEKYKNACVEILIIFEHLEEELLNEIPNKFIELIRENANMKHEFEFDSLKQISKQDIMPETRALLAVIYEEYMRN